MKAKDLIRLNNEKRKQLSEENLQYYEELLVYIRLSFHNAELDTEEILSELLDHLLEAQAEGRTARDIFGDDPKKYADSILGELPRKMFKEWSMFAVMGILYFFAASVILSGIFAIFAEGSSRSYFAGTVAIRGLLSIPVALVLLYMLIRFLRWFFSTKLHKAVQAAIVGLFNVAVIGIFVAVYFLIPDIGPVVEVPAYAVILTGLALLALATLVHKLTRV